MLYVGGDQAIADGKLGDKLECNFLDNSGQILLVFAGVILLWGMVICL